MNPLNKFTDQILLDLCQAGDANAFEVIYNRYVDKIYRFVYFRINEKDMVDDLTNEIFLKTWRQIRDNKKIDNLKAYLYKITRNLIIDHYRTRREQIDIEKVPHLVDDGQDLVSEINLTDDLEYLKKKIKNLRTDYREVLIFRYIEDLTIAEIAEILDKTEGAVKVMTHRAINKLKEIYDQESDE